jgi:hypothetical protein
MISSPLAELLEDVADLQREAAARRQVEGPAYAPEFNPLRFCRTDEVGLSEILRWMLDPSESHAQGTAFLQAFFEVFGINGVGRAAVATCARTEVITHSIPSNLRRIDILVRCGRFVLAIENKPFADFQEDQVPDYCGHLEKIAKGGFAIVILKGWSGQAPADQLIVGGQRDERILDSDYSQVVEWLGLSLDRCHADRVSEFLDHFRTFVETEILGGVSMREQKMILEAVKGADRQRAALDIIAAAETLFRDLHNGLYAALRRRKKRGWVVRNDRQGRAGRNSSYYHHLTIDFGGELPAVFAVDVPSYGTELFAGLVRRAGLAHVARKQNAISNRLHEELFPGFVEGSWIWWAHQQTFLDEGLLRLSETNIWKAMIEPDELAAAIVDFAHRIEVQVKHALRESLKPARDKA